MNPLAAAGSGKANHTGPGFRKGRNSRSGRSVSNSKYRGRKRRTRSRVVKSVKLKQSSGSISYKKSLKCSLLNVNGLTEASLESVKDVLNSKQPDLCILLETKRRLDEECLPADVDGYDLTEVRRSDIALDKAGGGLAIYTKKTDGLVFKDYDPDIADPSHLFVRKERAWKTVESVRGKTAICAVYAGFQAADDRHGTWNDTLYSVLCSEVHSLRQAGFRVVLLGDFNGHIGSNIGGNHHDINKNGQRFLNFLSNSSCAQINGRADITTGLWTRQQGGISSVLDYAVVSVEHLPSVQSMFIDDQGCFGGGSDHNWIFLEMTDNFVKKVRKSNYYSNKSQSWNISEYQDWSGFTSSLNNLVDQTDSNLDSFDLSKRVADILVKAGLDNIGYKRISRGTSMKATALPRYLVNELSCLKKMERNWKSKTSSLSSLPLSLRNDQLKREVNEAENLFLIQKTKVKALFFERKRSVRSSILKKCSGNSAEATQCFWSHLNKKSKKSNDIDAVFCPETGTLHCSPEEIAMKTEEHLQRLFSGSTDPFPAHSEASDHTYHDSARNLNTSDPLSDHPYSSSASPQLPASDGSGSLQTDPDGWINKAFTLDEVVSAVKKLKRGKAVGIDGLPNEFIINAGMKFWGLLTTLYNKVKSSGKFPPGWNSGKISLIHKCGKRELLSNYRPAPDMVLTILLPVVSKSDRQKENATYKSLSFDSAQR